MATPSKKPEDQLTESLAQTLDDPAILRSFWDFVAPSRLRSTLPERPPEVFGRLGTSKPDLLFWSGDVPLLYIEAKLESQTEPLQLIRARSWMRKYGAGDDQLVYLSHFTDTIPPEVGWPNCTLPMRTVSWDQLAGALATALPNASTTGRRDYSVFEKLLRVLAPAGSSRRKAGLLSDLRHDYGRVLHEFITARSALKGDFVYGARIAPRLTYGFVDWRAVFRDTDLERIWLFYGPDGATPENYRAQLILWHRSDIAGSDVLAQAQWRAWRQAIAAEPLAEFEWGGRQHADRMRGSPPPSMFPTSYVGLVSLAKSRMIHGSTAIRLTRPELLKSLQDMVAPLERIVARMAAYVSTP